jgi:hypothetical protein
MLLKGLEKEAWLVNNPALGSYLLWMFCKEHFNQSNTEIHPSKLFCIFPILFYSDTRMMLSGTAKRSGLNAYLAKFSTTKACLADVPLSIHSRVDEQKEKTYESLIVAFDVGLLTIDIETGLITPNLLIKPKSRVDLDDTTKELVDCAIKLGFWFSKMSMDSISKTIKVFF